MTPPARRVEIGRTHGSAATADARPPCTIAGSCRSSLAEETALIHRPDMSRARLARRLPLAYVIGILGALAAPLVAARVGVIGVADLVALECILGIAILGPVLGVLLAEAVYGCLGEPAAAMRRSSHEPRLVLWRNDEREPRGEVIRLFPAASAWDAPHETRPGA